MIDPCHPLRMANSAWRAFTRLHPLWHAPIILAGCGAAVIAGGLALPRVPAAHATPATHMEHDSDIGNTGYSPFDSDGIQRLHNLSGFVSGGSGGSGIVLGNTGAGMGETPTPGGVAEEGVTDSGLPLIPLTPDLPTDIVSLPFPIAEPASSALLGLWAAMMWGWRSIRRINK